MYRPCFSMTIRDKRKALWVTMPNNDKWNIGDLDKTTLEKAQDAIIHAFELGYKAHGMIDTSSYIPYDAKFEESK